MTPEKIRIEEPCTASWRKMTPGDGGRFCGSCEKVVVDFTKKTDEEVIAFFREKSGEHVCGRFTTTQVSTPALDRSRRRWRWATTVLTFVLGASLLAACKKQAVRGKTQGAVRKPPAAATPGVHYAPEKRFHFSGILLIIAFLFGLAASSCRRHVMGAKFTIRVKAKTQETVPSSQPK